MSMREIVEAGAGCGKTYGLVTRYLAALGVERGGDAAALRPYQRISPSKILSLTFTNDAAEEMKERIIAALSDRPHLAKEVEEQGRISTFHSFCYKILRPHFERLGYRSGDILSEVEAYSLKISHILSVLAISPHSESVQKILDLKKLTSFCAANWRRPPREWLGEVDATYADVRRSTEAWRSDALAAFRAAATERPDLLENAEAWPYLCFEALGDNNWPPLGELVFNKNIKKWWTESFPQLGLIAKTAREFVQKSYHLYLDPQLCEQEKSAFASLAAFLEEVQQSAPKILDFEALEYEALRLVREENLPVADSLTPQIPKYDLIIVDEFQDTNQRQIEILHQFCHPATEFYFVGDPKQSIYSFRGGDVRVFAEQKATLQLSSLDVNRRSQPEVLEFMNTLTSLIFVDAEDPSPQQLLACAEKTTASLAQPSTVNLIEVGDKRDAAFWDRLASDLKKSPHATRAVLCQKWSRATAAHEELQRRGISTLLGSDLDMARHHLSALWIAFLKAQDSNAQAQAYWNHLAQVWNLTPLADNATAKIAQDPRAWLRQFVQVTEPQRWPQGLLWLASLEHWIQNHGEQWRWVPRAKELASSFQKSMNLRLNLEAPESPLTQTTLGDENPVVITTVHKSKGLQYQNVYLFDLFDGNRRGGGFRVTDADEDESLESFKLLAAEGQQLVSLYFKKKQSLEEARLLAEKKRLFYVAYTRAETELFFYLDAKNSAAEGKATERLENQVWQWPRASALNWESAIYRAGRTRAGAKYLNHEALEKNLDGALPDIARPAQWLWQTPAPRRPLPPPTPPFYRLGTRAYIDQVLPNATFSGSSAYSPQLFAALPDQDWIQVGSSLHKILETWDGRLNGLEHLVSAFHHKQRKLLFEALEALAQFPDLQPLWHDAQHHPERLLREMGVFVHGDDHRLSGFADLIWLRAPDHAVILDWKSSSTLRAAQHPQKIAKTKAQVELYAQSLAGVIPKIEVWSLAIVFSPVVSLTWLFREPSDQNRPSPGANGS